ncbi:hypothetical protein Hanom_Chr10g00905601 [Helianthus anomalus]
MSPFSFVLHLLFSLVLYTLYKIQSCYTNFNRFHGSANGMKPYQTVAPSVPLTS